MYLNRNVTDSLSDPLSSEVEINLTSTTDSNESEVYFGCDAALKTLRIGLTAFTVLCIILGSIAGNLFVCLVFYKRPSLLTISNRFILNLTFCNILNTFFVMPFVFVTTVTGEWIFKEVWCQSTGFLMNLIFAASTLTLVVISIDRYCAVISPLHYSMRITIQRATLMIIGVWVLAIVSALPPLVGWNHFEYQPEKYSCTVLWRSPNYTDRTYTLFLSLICFVMPLLVILWVYTIIFRAARDSSERTRRNSVVPNNGEEQSQTPLRYGRRRSSTAPIILSRKLSTSSRTSSLLWHRDEWKAAITSMLVISTFIICWLPYFVIIVMESTAFARSEDIHPFLQGTAIFLALSSGLFNPLVYVFRSKVARQELMSILQSKRNPGLVRQSSTANENSGSFQKRGSDVSQKEPPLTRDFESGLPRLTSLTETTLTSVTVGNCPPSNL